MVFARLLSIRKATASRYIRLELWGSALLALSEVERAPSRAASGALAGGFFKSRTRQKLFNEARALPGKGCNGIIATYGQPAVENRL
jgi:hypothetical protein